MSNDKQHIIFKCQDSFEGILTSVFESYYLKIIPKRIMVEDSQQNLFAEDILSISPEIEKAERVLKGIEKRFGKAECHKIYRVFLSEDNERAMLIFKYIRCLIDNKKDMRTAYHLPEILAVKQILKKVSREVHRMHAFVRFKETNDQSYVAIIEPDYNVLPLIASHFKRRYNDQVWFIFDAKRQYAIHWDKQNVAYVYKNNHSDLDLNAILAKEEDSFATWWKTYFKATTIAERKNAKLHKQHVPMRYWKYLTEKF